jgi:hypothetical protein
MRHVLVARMYAQQALIYSRLLAAWPKYLIYDEYPKVPKVRVKCRFAQLELGGASSGKMSRAISPYWTFYQYRPTGHYSRQYRPTGHF